MDEQGPGKVVVRSFRDLVVWQRAMQLAEECFVLGERLPPGSLRALRDQMQRSSASIPANIAEGNGRQRLGDYLRFLSIAGGSLTELQTQIELAVRLGLVGDADVARARSLSEEVSRMLRALIKALERRKERPRS
jgi:four helix bundle protein